MRIHLPYSCTGPHLGERGKRKGAVAGLKSRASEHPYQKAERTFSLAIAILLAFEKNYLLASLRTSCLDTQVGRLGLSNDQTELIANLSAYNWSAFMEGWFSSLARARQASTELENWCTGHRQMVFFPRFGPILVNNIPWFFSLVDGDLCRHIEREVDGQGRSEFPVPRFQEMMGSLGIGNRFGNSPGNGWL